MDVVLTKAEPTKIYFVNKTS